MKITFTPSGTQEMENYLSQQTNTIRKIIIERISEKKSVLGDDLLEITASDVKEAAQHVRIERKMRSRTSLATLTSFIYIIGGACVVIYGIFYDQIKALLNTNPTRAVTVGLGFSLMLAGICARIWFQIRQNNIEAEEQARSRLITSGRIYRDERDS
ncbi:MAG: hypothetical protein JO056_00960 [Alphaproteobacteria bacterium]|nr:hypothetical protein [Alphaproteobacteria bacterium]